MKTLVILREISRSRVNKIVIAIALGFTICGVAAGPALADSDRGNHRGWHHHEGRPGYRYWRGPRAYYSPAPNYYYAPRRYYEYEPPPVVYYPRPPTGIELFFGLR